MEGSALRSSSVPRQKRQTLCDLKKSRRVCKSCMHATGGGSGLEQTGVSVMQQQQYPAVTQQRRCLSPGLCYSVPVLAGRSSTSGTPCPTGKPSDANTSHSHPFQRSLISTPRTLTECLPSSEPEDLAFHDVDIALQATSPFTVDEARGIEPKAAPRRTQLRATCAIIISCGEVCDCLNQHSNTSDLCSPRRHGRPPFLRA